MFKTGFAGFLSRRSCSTISRKTAVDSSSLNLLRGGILRQLSVEFSILRRCLSNRHHLQRYARCVSTWCFPSCQIAATSLILSRSFSELESHKDIHGFPGPLLRHRNSFLKLQLFYILKSLKLLEKIIRLCVGRMRLLLFKPAPDRRGKTSKALRQGSCL